MIVLFKYTRCTAWDCACDRLVCKTIHSHLTKHLTFFWRKSTVLLAAFGRWRQGFILQLNLYIVCSLSQVGVLHCYR